MIKSGNDYMSLTDQSRGRIYAASRKSSNRTAYEDGVGSHEPCYHHISVCVEKNEAVLGAPPITLLPRVMLDGYSTASRHHRRRSNITVRILV